MTSDSGYEQRLVICIGDIHGYYSKLKNLWCNLKIQTNPSQFDKALIIFLGDYCDKGPDTNKVIDFLIDLPTKYPNQKHVFLLGNHDFGFSAFLGLLPPPCDGSEFKEGWKEYDESSKELEGWYCGEGYEDMHVQGRRWGGKIKIKLNQATGTYFKGSVNSSGPTFETYGVPHGSFDLRNAVPDEHKKFLANLVWFHEEDNVWVEKAEGRKKCKLIAVHAGIHRDKPVEQQLKLLKSKDTSKPVVECVQGRENFRDMPQELKEHPTIVVSGHHGRLHINDLRLIIDEMGGHEHKPLAAIILPSMKVIRDTDCSDENEI
ncbi:unnamed protein product [Amaranthus hypochondriacus]